MMTDNQKDTLQRLIYVTQGLSPEIDCAIRAALEEIDRLQKKVEKLEDTLHSYERDTCGW